MSLQTVKCASCQEQSTELDFCSHCGTQIGTAPGANGPLTVGITPTGAPPAAAASHAHETCPKCTSERDDATSVFCGTCGYNFVTKQGGDVMPPDEAPAKSTSAPVSSPASATVGIATGGPRMDVTITVDFTVPTAPRVKPAQSFPLFDEESLIGRRNSALKQTLAIDDEAVSKRHALIVRHADGRYVIRDLDSTNGTRVNGTPLAAGVDQPLKEQDVIRLGEFTIITVQAIRQA